MSELKLYVVGEVSGDPARWSSYGGLAIVIAENPDHARRLAPQTITGRNCPVAEVDMTEPRLVWAKDVTSSD